MKKITRKTMIIVDIICVLLLIISLFLGARFFMAKYYAKNFQDGRMDGSIMETLLLINLPERYLPYYNLGNQAYYRGDYDEAIIRFEQALDRKPGLYKEERDCDVRINLALAMLKQIDLSDLSTEKKVKTVIRQLQAARNVLTEVGCANPAVGIYDGHSEEAEQIKKEIDEMIQKLQEESSSSGDDEQGNQPQEQEKKKGESAREKEIREKMEEQKKESAEARAEAKQYYDYLQEGDEYHFHGKEW